MRRVFFPRPRAPGVTQRSTLFGPKPTPHHGFMARRPWTKGDRAATESLSSTESHESDDLDGSEDSLSCDGNFGSDPLPDFEDLWRSVGGDDDAPTEPKPRRSLWQRAYELAEHPTIFQQVMHSAPIVGCRRARKVSTLGNVAARVSALAAYAIPVPIINRFFEKAIAKGHSNVVRAHHGAMYSNTGNTPEQQAKHGWKAVDTSSMDLRREKIVLAVRSLNEELVRTDRNAKKYLRELRACDLLIRPFSRYAYVKRRTAGLRADVEKIMELCEQTRTWLDQVDDDVNGWAAHARDNLAEIDSEHLHDNCDPRVCVFGDAVYAREKRSPVPQWVGTTLRTLRDAFNPDYFYKDFVVGEGNGNGNGNGSGAPAGLGRRS